MDKRNLILFIVLLAYSVILAHSFIPHTHSTFQAEKQTGHHHHGADDHHHDHEDEDQHAEHDPLDLFQFFHHTEVTGTSFIESRRIESATKPSRITKQVFIATSFLLPAIEGPPLVYFNKEFDNCRPQKATHFFFPLKAPPANYI